MRVSANELRSTTVKAFRGAGFSLGNSQDLGRAVIWLHAHDLNGAAAATTAIDSPQSARRTGRCSTLAPGEAGSVWSTSAAAVAFDGPAALDLLHSRVAGAVTLSDIDAPFLVLGLAGAAAQDHRCGYVVTIFPEPDVTDEREQTAELVVGPDGLTGSPEVLIGAAGMALSADRTDSTQSPAAPQAAETARSVIADGIDVSNIDWVCLSAHAAKLRVPATEASRLGGAGAGLTDND